MQEFLKEVPDNYEKCHSNCTQMSPDTLAFSIDNDGTAAKGLAGPVCVNDHMRLTFS